MAGRNESFFVPGFGISRPVLLANLPLYLGPEAIARPYTYQGRDGFLITAYRPFTEAQLADLRSMSARWEAEIAERRYPDSGIYAINRPENISSTTPGYPSGFATSRGRGR